MKARVAMCGCGALGARIAYWLVLRKDIEFILIDDDEIEVANLITDIYEQRHLGRNKAVVLAEVLWHVGRVKSLPISMTLEEPDTFVSCDAVVDTFDNFASRQLTRCERTLHVGLAEGGMGASVWDERWVMPSVYNERGQNPVCTHELGAYIAQATAYQAAELVKECIQTGERRDGYCDEKGRL